MVVGTVMVTFGDRVVAVVVALVWKLDLVVVMVVVESTVLVVVEETVEVAARVS